MTYIIIFITCAVSIICLRNGKMFDRLSLKPYMIHRHKQWYRVLTHGFVHGDTMHLMVNMFVLWSFGTYVEEFMKTQAFIGTVGSGRLYFCMLYFGGMAAASAYDIYKRKNDPRYCSVGASGAVSAVVFTSIFTAPLSMIYLMGIIPIPGVLFGILYLLYERFSANRSGDNINHYAHIAGAVYGFIFPLLMNPGLVHLFIDSFRR